MKTRLVAGFIVQLALLVPSIAMGQDAAAPAPKLNLIVGRSKLGADSIERELADDPGSTPAGNVRIKLENRADTAMSK